MKKRRAVPLLLGCALLFATAATAEETQPAEGFESYSLGEVYIKGEKPPVTKEASLTTVVTAEDIRATNSQTVADALRNAAGFHVTSGQKNEPNVSIHGIFGQYRLLVLIDGVPYYETRYGSLDLNQFATSNIAKIEVTKGAASVLYGANALGGVINIITKQPVGKPSFDVTVEGGEVDYLRTSASHGMKKGPFYYWLNYEHAQAHGWRMSDDFDPRLATITTRSPNSTYFTYTEDGGTRNQSDYVTDNVWAKFGITPTKDSDYSINFHYIEREKGNPPDLDESMVRFGPAGSRFSRFFRFKNYIDWGLDLSGQQKVSDLLTLKAKAFYHNHVDELASYSDKTYTDSIALSKYTDYLIGGSLIAELNPVEWDTLRLAFNYRGDSHKERGEEWMDFDKYFAWTGSVGLENEVRVLKNFSFVLGGSYDWFKITDVLISGVNEPAPNATTSFNPMVGVTYTFEDTTKLFASAAHKTRFPTLNSLYSSKGGNTDLKAEKAINVTVGASRSFGDFAWGQVAFFWHDISDLITRASTAIDALYHNIGNVEVYGYEVSTEIYPIKDMVLRLAYNFNNATDTSDDRVTRSVTNVPEHKLDMGFQYTIPYIKTRVDLNGILCSSVYDQLPSIYYPTDPKVRAGGWFVLNSRVSKKFLKNFEAYVAINNIFDREYEPEVSYPAPGRNIYGGITATF